MGGTPSLFVARVTGGPGSNFYQRLAVYTDTPVQRNHTVVVAVPADVRAVVLSMMGQGVRTMIALQRVISRGRKIVSPDIDT